MWNEVKCAVEERLALRFEDAGTTAYRLFSDERLTIDRFGPVAVLQIYEESFDPRPVAQVLLEAGIESVYRKRFVPDRTSAEVAFDPKPFLGKPSPAEITVLENGLSFLIRPFEGYSPGLFLDQRENRKFLASLARGGEWLNGFSYTCGFSVYLARAGSKVTSIDLSKRYLDWGRKNFALNEVPEAGHRFFAEDFVKFVDKEIRRGRRYEGLVLDPPSFGRFGGKTFAIKKDLAPLVRKASELAGWLFLSSNYSGFDSQSLRSILPEAEVMELPEAPPDFQGEAHPLSAVLFRLA